MPLTVLTLYRSAFFSRWCNNQVLATLESALGCSNLTVVSPKFFRKLTYIQTLSELAYEVPLTQIDIPPAVYQSVLTRNIPYCLD
jgi:hypothetical protein